MLVIRIVCISMVILGLNANLVPDVVYDQVRQYLDQQFGNERVKKNVPVSANEETLPNSNKIGLGYNLLYGNPVCYTGTCQMEGFARPVFKLDFSQRPQGSCTSKYIPTDVDLDCLPATEVQAGTEIIDTIDQLQQSMMSGVDLSIGAAYKQASFSYTRSSQSRYMIDNIVKFNKNILYTTAKVSLMKLSLFAPLANLSHQFRYVIDRLPCCDIDEFEVEKYIRDNIFDYFGFTYVSSMLLGGVAQQLLFIDKSQMTTIETQSYSLSDEGRIEFFASLGIKQTNSYNSTKHTEFMKYVQKASATTLGGETSIQSLEEWSKTVKDNPIVIKLGIRNLLDLLTEERFPNDRSISNKRKLIEKALEKYVKGTVYCYNNCSNNGECKASTFFQFGMCKCHADWKGIDCSIPRPYIPSGTLCGWRDAITCDGSTTNNCPDNWQSWKVPQIFLDEPDFGFSCFKTTGNRETSHRGALCGIYSDLVPLKTLCDGKNPETDGCPIGYERQQVGLDRYDPIATLCYKVDSNVDDLPGTLCGGYVHNFAHKIGAPVLCDGFSVENGSCPRGYMYRNVQMRLPGMAETIELATCLKN